MLNPTTMNGKSQKSHNNQNAMYIHTYFTKKKWSKYTLFTLYIIHTKMQYTELYQYDCNRKIISVSQQENNFISFRSTTVTEARQNNCIR